MKPLLRAVLIIDALLLLAFGLLFLLTPWKSLYDGLHLVQTEPALVGQGFGIALVGLAWLALHASIDGALTTATARVIGHVNWLVAVLMLVWLIGLHTPALTGFGQLVAVLTAVVLLVVGLGGVRLASAVRRRERALAAETAAADRAQRAAARQAAKDAKRDARTQDAVHVEPVAAGYASASEPVVEPVLSPRQATVVDPATGRTVDTVTGRTVDPISGRPVADPAVAASPTSPVAPASSAPLTEREAEAAREEARRDAAGTRPPFHG
jgi:type II secretory pathway pseudopilin PulG